MGYITSSLWSQGVPGHGCQSPQISTGICPSWPFCPQALAARGFCPQLWSLLSRLCAHCRETFVICISAQCPPHWSLMEIPPGGRGGRGWGGSFTVEPWRFDVGAVLGHLLLRRPCWHGLLCQLLRQLARSWLPEVGQAGPPDLWGGAVDPGAPRPSPPAALCPFLPGDRGSSHFAPWGGGEGFCAHYPDAHLDRSAWQSLQAPGCINSGTVVIQFWSPQEIG